MTKVVDINNIIMTKDEISPMIMKIEHLHSILYSDKPQQIAGILKSEEFMLIDAYISSHEMSYDDIEGLCKLLEKLKKDVSSLPVLRMKVAVGKLKESWETIFVWIKSNLSKGAPFVIDLDTDPNIIGGVVIYWQGKIIDLSLRKSMRSFFDKEVQNVLG